MPLTFEATRAAGATLGSGVIMVFDETVDLVDTLRRIAQFFRDESCGQCVPCRVGSVRQEELLARLAGGLAGAGRARRSWCSCARSARRCATRRSAGSARPPRRRSSRRCASRGWWRCDATDTTGLSMTRDPAPDAATAARRARPPAAQPLTDILLRRRPAPSRPPARAAVVEAPPPIELTIDGVAGHGRRPGTTILDACRAAGHRHADAVLRREPDAGQRLPRVRRRGHRLARPRAGLLAHGRGRDGGPDRLRAGPHLAQGRPRVPRLVGRRVAGRTGRAGRLDRVLHGPLRRGSDAVRAAGRARRRRRARRPRGRPPPRPERRRGRSRRPSPSRRRSTTSSTSATTRSASSATSASRRAARTPRTRSPSPSPGAASTPASRPSRPSRCPSRPASTAATASASARPAR